MLWLAKAKAKAKAKAPRVAPVRIRRALKVAIVAQAHRMARSTGAVVAHARPYHKGDVGVQPF